LRLATVRAGPKVDTPNQILLDSLEDVHGLSNALTLALASPVKLDAASEHDFPDSYQISKSKAAAFLDALEGRNFQGGRHFSHGVPFPGGEDLGGAAVHHAAQGEDDGVEGEVAGWEVADLVIGDRVEVLVDQPCL
jgi:hypothetical protein